MLRKDEPPADQRDLEDRYTTRATSDELTLNRYLRFQHDRTAQEWHRTLQGLVPRVAWAFVGLAGTVVLTVLYVVIVVALQHLLPNLTINQDMLIAGAALGAALGGSGLGLAGQMFKARFGRGREPGAGSPT